MGEQIFLYCERGLDPGFWAEPINAVSNAAFVAAALLAWGNSRSLAAPLPADQRCALTTLSALVAFVGAGSFAFHTLARPAAQVLDVVPIGLFMFAALWLTLRWVSAWTQRNTALALISFALATGGATWAMAALGCQIPTPTARIALLPCLNGGWAYLPALGALALCARLALHQSPAAAVWLMSATGVFAVSLAARSLDWTACVPSMRLSLHALWHLGAAATAYCILRALTAAACHAARVTRPNVRAGLRT